MCMVGFSARDGQAQQEAVVHRLMHMHHRVYGYRQHTIVMPSHPRLPVCQCHWLYPPTFLALNCPLFHAIMSWKVGRVFYFVPLITFYLATKKSLPYSFPIIWNSSLKSKPQFQLSCLHPPWRERKEPVSRQSMSPSSESSHKLPPDRRGMI